MRPLAIIEPDAYASTDLRLTIESAGYAADCFNEGREAVFSLRKRPFALAIVNLSLCDTDPFALCGELSSILPVIAVACSSDPDLCVRALEAGADDCVARPITGRELLARIQNVLRRADRTDERTTLSSSLSEMRIREGGAIHDLTRGETEILSLLLQYAPAPMTIAEMATLLGAKRGTVESRIKTLRRKLGTERLVSRGRLGYQLLPEQ